MAGCLSSRSDRSKLTRHDVCDPVLWGRSTVGFNHFGSLFSVDDQIAQDGYDARFGGDPQGPSQPRNSVTQPRLLVLELHDTPHLSFSNTMNVSTRMLGPDWQPAKPRCVWPD